MNSSDYEDQAWALWREIRDLLRERERAAGGWTEQRQWEVNHLFARAGDLMHLWSEYVSRHRYDQRGYKGGQHLYEWADKGFLELLWADEWGPELPDGRPSKAWRAVMADDGRAEPPALPTLKDQVREPR